VERRYCRGQSAIRTRVPSPTATTDSIACSLDEGQPRMPKIPPPLHHPANRRHLSAITAVSVLSITCLPYYSALDQVQQPPILMRLPPTVQQDAAEPPAVEVFILAVVSRSRRSGGGGSGEIIISMLGCEITIFPLGRKKLVVP
jgi:hypothetical protein